MRGDDEEVGHRLERRRELLRQGRLLPGAPLDDDAAGAVDAGEDAGREIRFRRDPLIEIVKRSGAAAVRNLASVRGGLVDLRPFQLRRLSPAPPARLTPLSLPCCLHRVEASLSTVPSPIL